MANNRAFGHEAKYLAPSRAAILYAAQLAAQLLGFGVSRPFGRRNRMALWGSNLAGVALRHSRLKCEPDSQMDPPHTRRKRSRHQFPATNSASPDAAPSLPSPHQSEGKPLLRADEFPESAAGRHEVLAELGKVDVGYVPCAPKN